MIDKMWRRATMLLVLLAIGLGCGTARAQAQGGAPPAPAPQIFEGPADVVIFIEVQAGAIDKAVALLKQYRAAVRKEAANRGVQLIQEIGRPNRLAIVEVWTDQAAFDAHDKGALAARLRERLNPIEIAPRDRRLHHDFAVSSGKKPPKGALYVIAHIDVNPPNRPTTEPILKQLVEDSHNDTGNLSFGIYQQNNALNHYGGIAVWRDRQSFEAHERAAHTQTARAGLAPLLGALYDERLYRIIE